VPNIVKGAVDGKAPANINHRQPVAAEDVPPAPPLAVEQAISSIKLQDGFVLERVTSEPYVFSPIAMVFDGDGRMWVCEMNTFMPDVEGNGEEVPEGNIALLQDTDGDGVVDKRSVFIDDVVLPRTIALVKGGILYADHSSLYFAEVLEGDKLGIREVVDVSYAEGGSLEHKTNTMLHGLDNWYYNAKSDKKYKAIALSAAIPEGSQEIYRNAYWKMVRGSSDYRGQWGLSMDDYGRLYHNGNSEPARGEFLRPGSLMKNPGFATKMPSANIGGFRVHPIRINPGVNRGYLKRTLINEGEDLHKLRNFTAASGNAVYRGDNFPDEYYGISLTPEPAGNLISARKIVELEHGLSGKELYINEELLASTDERFRPVNLYTAPDGTLYIIDMYHGIIQHRVFVTDYLRDQILSRDLDKNNNTMGRIYRLRWKNKAAGEQPQLQNLAAAELVDYLAHNNGWWRDTARRLIVESADKSVAAAIVELIKTSADYRAQINALWTLHGLEAVNMAAVKAGLNANHSMVKVSAIAVSEKLAAGEKSEMAALLLHYASYDYQVAMQVALSAGAFEQQSSFQALQQVLTSFGEQPHIHRAIVSGLAGREAEFQQLLKPKKDKKFLQVLAKVKMQQAGGTSGSKDPLARLSSSEKALFTVGRKLYGGTAACFSCHGPDGQGQENMGPPLVSSEWVLQSPERLAKIMLKGMTGPLQVNGKHYNPVMVMPGLGSNKTFDNYDLAAIATYIRNEWGNRADVVDSKLFKRVRQQSEGQTSVYSAKEL